MAGNNLHDLTASTVAQESRSQWGHATDLSAKSYSNLNLPQQEGGRRLTEFMKIREGQHVLVVGCGPGKDTLAIAGLVGPSGSVEGIDIDKHSIVKADAALQERPDIEPFVKHHVGDVHDLSRFAGQKFDHVHINATYHWLKDQPLFLQNVASVCTTGATIGIAGGDGNMQQPIFIIREKVCKELDLFPTVLFTYPTDKELMRDLPAAGFTDLSFNHFSGTYLFKDTGFMLEWLDVSTGNQYLGLLSTADGEHSEEKSQHAKQRILEEMEIFRLPTGQASILLSRLMVIAHFQPGKC